MKHKTIAEHMRDILIENDRTFVGWGDLDDIEECADRSTHTDLNDGNIHPRDRIKRVLDALDRSPLFEKGLYSICCGKQGSEHLARCFRLKTLGE